MRLSRVTPVLFSLIAFIDAAPNAVPNATPEPIGTSEWQRFKCDRNHNGFSFGYKIRGGDSSIPNPTDLCNRLWRSIRGKAACGVTSMETCGMKDGVFEWFFIASVFCHTGVRYHKVYLRVDRTDRCVARS